MYKNTKVLKPNKFFFKIDFESIKNKLESESKSILKDYGSIVIIDYFDHAVSVNNVGKVEVFFNYITMDRLNSLIRWIQTIFQSQISEFELLN